MTAGEHPAEARDICEPGGVQPANVVRRCYCAPGGRFAAALALAFTGREVTEIREHHFLAGSDEVVVVDVPELPSWDDGWLWHDDREPHGPLITGLPHV